MAQANAAERPNVVFILADDLGYGELGCYGQSKIPTPNIDRLAAQGRRFTRHYTGAPVCAPARCVLMSGKHLGHAEIRGNLQAKKNFPQFNEGQHPITEGVVTLAEAFKEAGYATGAMGKWGLGPVGSTGDPNKQGFDLFFGYNCQAVAHSFYPRYIWRNDEQIEINPNPIPGHRKKPTGEVKLEDYQAEQYAPYLMIDEAEDFISKHKDDPFFLYLAFIEPHVAMHPPEEAVDRFPKDWDNEAYRGQCGYLPHPRPRAGYAAMINDLDRYVGRVMEALEDAGVADNTIVVFTSDNGTTHPGVKTTHFHIGGVDADFFNSTLDLKGWKGSVYEGGLRVPMIVRYPGKVDAGSTSDTPGYFADWFPTLADAVGLKKPDGLDGQSLWPAITTGKDGGERKPMVWVYPEYGGQVAVNFGHMKVLRRGLKRKNPDPWEVYDVVKDRGETKNLAAEHPELIERAAKLLKEQTDENPLFPLTPPTFERSAASE
ncbi:arylsulfatase [Haloferula helveola]|uniref:Arylsulfatase n=1 Tax=Haloferula helveola TaxID=490095 RepID=A0ABN6GZF1_9BACT|nr:arylsulfatase [Haloferula helveola]